MTYRDLVLYDDFTRQRCWFPIANLMTHGIIKGNLEKLGSAEEPLEKFTDDVLLYFARGISMYELYISPDLLTEGEWNAISEAMLWARDRFPILSRTEMVGGDPGKRQAYGYIHWWRNRGIVAARNPWIDRAALKIRLDAADGLEAKASHLVLERVYPTRWISPRLFKAGEVAELPLEGFETAVYELYPVGDATRPLVAGARFDERNLDDGRHSITVFEGNPLLLNPQAVSGLFVKGVSRKNLDNIGKVRPLPSPLVSSMVSAMEGGARLQVIIDATVRDATVAVLVKPESRLAGRTLPRFAFRLDGALVNTTGEQEKGAWAWYLTTMGGGNHNIELTFPDSARWKGSVLAWVLSTQEAKGEEIICTTANTVKPPPMPPKPWPVEEVRRTSPIGKCVVGRQ